MRNANGYFRCLFPAPMSSLFQTSPGLLQLPEGLVLLNNPSTVIQAVKAEHGECSGAAGRSEAADRRAGRLGSAPL